MVSMLVSAVASLAIMMAFGRAISLGFKKRWRLSIVARGFADVIAFAFASTSQDTNPVGGVIYAGLIAIATITGA